MQTDYISRASLEWKIHTGMNIIEAMQAIIDEPAADVVERQNGEWVWKHRNRGGFRRYTGIDDNGEKHTITVDGRSEIDDPYCPFCGKLNESVFLNFCPNCGAKMDGDNHAEE